MKKASPRRIQPEERDYELLRHWPTPPDGTWTSEPVDPNDSATTVLRRRIPTDLGFALDESVLRLPSAPIYAIHRKRDYSYQLDRVNYHTFRLLRRVDAERIHRVYLLHNGLNEIQDIGFYHRLAAGLLASDSTAACLLRPFPGHLSRHPFEMKYSQHPLDTYLLDAGNLFRQYLRFMVETQWLLSILTPCADYRTVAGLDLLARTGVLQTTDRFDPAVLARAILWDWTSLWAENKQIVSDIGDPVDEASIRGTVRALRLLLDWHPGGAGTDNPPRGVCDLLPFVHVIGYSLGGFTAQSVFFTWPFAIATCTTVCSGGALRDVGLTAFAHREEWKSVIHAIPYEIESAMVEKANALHLDRESGTIAGMKMHYFSCFYRIFRDVFLQESRGSYASRVSEYVSRLFFVVGGTDPIVTLQAVQDASPPEGLNLLEIANLSHFPMREGSKEWQEFWLPKVCSLISEFAVRSEVSVSRTLAANWCDETGTEWRYGALEGIPERRPVRYPELDPETGNEALDSEQFQNELANIVRDAVEKPGFLFIMRNDLPTALLGRKLLHLRGTALHHSDPMIRRYIEGLQKRRSILLDNARDKVRLLIPSQLGEWFVRPQPAFSPAVEAAYARVPSEQDLREVWEEFRADWCETGSLRDFDPKHPGEPVGEVAQWNALVQAGAGLVLNTLPDVWLALSPKALGELIEAERVATPRARILAETSLLYLASQLMGVGDLESEDNAERERLKRFLLEGSLRIVKVSGARFNPRFMGWRVREWKTAYRMIIHSAVAYVRSRSAAPGP